MNEQNLKWKKIIAIGIGILLLLTATFFGKNQLFGDKNKDKDNGNKVVDTKPEPDTGTKPDPDTKPEPNTSIDPAYVLASAKKPELVQMPDIEKFSDDSGVLDFEKYDAAYREWEESQKQLQVQSDDYFKGYQEFLREINPKLLKDQLENNRVYSPLNIYLALSMLAETTAGNSRAEILNLLKTDTIENVRKNSQDLWKESYQNDGTYTSLLANSIWLREGEQYKQDTLDILAKDYYASTFKGVMGDTKYDNQLHNWINENTNNLLKDEAGELKFSEDTIMGIVSTIYFNSAWKGEFLDSEEGTFYAPKEEIKTTFMKEKDDGILYWGENFKAVKKLLNVDGSMWIIVPDEGVSTSDVVANEELYDMVDNYDYKNQKDMKVTLVMPKFDTTTDLDLIEVMKEMGVNDIFNSDDADFSNISDRNNLEISQIKHAARVKVDEKGLEAAAFTAMMMEATSAPPQDMEEIEIRADKPFLFVIANNEGRALFSGVINTLND